MFRENGHNPLRRWLLMKRSHQKGQALIELIIFLPLMFMFYSMISGFANAINGSINQQKIARSYFYYRLQNNSTIPKPDADAAMDAAACIGCGACVAACKNASAMLFTAAKVSHLGYLPQGQPERQRRVLKMVEQMDSEGFGNCTNTYDCEAACPKGISVHNIARLNRDFLKAKLFG